MGRETERVSFFLISKLQVCTFALIPLLSSLFFICNMVTLDNFSSWATAHSFGGPQITLSRDRWAEYLWSY